MTKRLAQCACGQLHVACDGEPLLVSVCHCCDCQRRTGSAFGIAAFYDVQAVRVSGASKSFTRPSETGFPVTFHFCPECGTSLYWLPARKPGQIAVAAGAFADPDFPAPAKSTYTERRHSWLTWVIDPE
jgi:hypothetical protein